MRLPDDVLKCVCFLCLKNRQGRERFFGTAFFASIRSEMSPRDIAYSYLITARHNIKEVEAEIKNDPKRDYQLSVRINTGNGDAKIIELPDRWHYPPNDIVDVAVMPADKFEGLDVDYMNLPLACSATEEKIRHHGIGIGSEVFVSGLFSLHKGTKRNLPIVRQGIIASMTDEQLTDIKTRKRYDAYLTEVLATKGMSGSPVLVKSNRAYVADEDPQCRVLLLGLMMGHFRDELEGYPKDKGDEFHAGLSKVVPVQEILSVINGESLLKQRQKEDALHTTKG